MVLALLAALQAGGYEFSRIFSRFASTESDSDISAIIVLCTQSISYREPSPLNFAEFGAADCMCPVAWRGRAGDNCSRVPLEGEWRRQNPISENKLTDCENMM